MKFWDFWYKSLNLKETQKQNREQIYVRHKEKQIYATSIRERLPNKAYTKFDNKINKQTRLHSIIIRRNKKLKKIKRTYSSK